jgi:hypothetical protein
LRQEHLAPHRFGPERGNRGVAVTTDKPGYVFLFDEPFGALDVPFEYPRSP